MRRKIVIIASCLFLLTTGYLNSQTASAVWQLIADTSAIVTGNISASVQILTDTMSVKDYSGGSGGGPAERIWRSNLNWPTETSENANRYIQYYINPKSGYGLTVQSIALNIGCYGTEGHMFANIYYSTDSTFSTRVKLNPSTITLPDIRYNPLMPLSYSINVSVDENKKFYLRIYPWYDSNPSATKYVCLTNVAISGNTVALNTPSLSVFPYLLDFGNVKVGGSKVLTYSLSGAYLEPSEGQVTITAPQGFEVSTNIGSGYSSSINISYVGGFLPDTTVYVKFSPASISQYLDTIKNSGGEATTCNIIVKGNGLSADTILGIFVSTDGNDSNPGTYYAPFATIAKAVSVASPGDTIFVRGGTYICTNQITISKNGIDTLNRSCLFAYKDERPVLDFSLMGTPGVSGSQDGIRLSGRYWHIRGLAIKGAPHNGIAIDGGSYNLIEFCSLFENRNTGLQLSKGASYNRIINCDSYFNRDSTSPSSYDGNADGFAPKLDVGTGNYFYGCRAWQNSDDGWDGYLRQADNVTTIIENCWCFMNGYLKNGSPSTGNGNGFKMGGGDNSNSDSLRHNMHLKNCLAFDNRVKGFDQNNNRGSMILYNNTSYRNGTNYGMGAKVKSGEVMILKNCLVYGSVGSIWSGAIQQSNSWLPPFYVDASDFVSVDTTGVRGPRKPDGSLPDITFMHLAQGSDLIDAGTDVGLPYNGSAPDLGCFETIDSQHINGSETGRIAEFKLYQNYPNPFNSSTVIKFKVAKAGIAKLKVVNILGQEIAVLFNGPVEAGNLYSVQFGSESLTSGVYFSILESGSERQVKKMMLLR